MIETLLAVALVAVAGLFVLWWAQRSLIYYPTAGAVPAAGQVIAGAEDVRLTTSDGVRLGAWFIPGSGATPRSAVVVFNGNAGDRADRRELAVALSQAGWSVLLFDYRGYGGNAGDPTEAGLLRDARAAVAHLESRPDIDRKRIAYFGESLGAAVATALAVERAPAALILRSPFTSLADIGSHHYPWLPVGPFIRDRYPIDEQIGHIGAPVLIIAGERDEIVPIRFSRAVYDAAGEPKRLVVIPGVDHNHPELLAGDRMMKEIREFLAELAPE